MSWSDLTNGVMNAAVSAFGETVVYTPSGGSPFSISGIFKSQYLEVDFSTGEEILSETPNLGVKNSDFASPPAQGDTLVVNDTTYTVHTVHKDGEAGSTILLYEGVTS